MITFKAHFIQNTTIQKRVFDKFHDKQVSFVEIDTQNPNDILCLKAVNASWDDKETYADDIVSKLCKIFKTKKDDEHTHFYAITKQVNGFDNLKNNDILGLVQVRRQQDDSGEIKFLQVAPKFQKINKKRGFKSIGSKLVENILSVMREKTIYLDSTEASMKLYQKYGFRVCNSFGRMVLKR
jgi:ribosomal protein S18 acetylase RimI-like enzyme